MYVAIHVYHISRVYVQYPLYIVDGDICLHRFKKAVNALTANMLHAHAAPCRFLCKQ